ncbi:hypothetical protein PENSPDRAFT_754017 [Peniophora sp. CONT]|nr:hypothetical protein PENSPDRAFT_754017 [Peniophora sp. CONT]
MANDIQNSSLQSLVLSRFSDNALSGIPRGLQLQTADAELETLMQTLYRARQMRNARAGPGRLPREILAYIFECLQPLWLPRRELDEKDAAGLEPVFCSGWMTVTHVCSFWREVALSFPSLWSNPTIDILSIPRQYIPDILLRSHSAALDLKLICEHESIQTRQDTSFNAWSSSVILRRARRLNIIADMELITYLAQRLSPSHVMERLHELAVSSWGAEGTLDLPAPFYNLPELTSLILWDYQVPWRCPILSSKLTELRLLYCDIGPRPTYQELYDLLSLLQSLQILELRETVPRRPIPSEGHLTDTIMAPSLRRLEIAVLDSELAMDALTFMSLIHAPPQCVCNYHINQLGAHDPDMTFVDDALGRLIPNLSLAGHNYTEMRHLLLTYRGLQLAGTPIPLQIASPSNRSSKLDLATIFNRLRIPHFSKLDPPIYFHLANYLSFVTLERLITVSLDSSSIRFIDDNDLWSCLLRADGVRRIGLVKTTAPASLYVPLLLDALRLPRALDTGDETRILFPQLEELALLLTEDEAAHNDVIIGIIDLVHARLQNGTPLLELVISREAAHWAVWTTLRALLKITFIDYPLFDSSPVMPKVDTV